MGTDGNFFLKIRFQIQIDKKLNLACYIFRVKEIPQEDAVAE